MDPVLTRERSASPIQNEFQHLPYEIDTMVHCDGLMLCKCADHLRLANLALFGIPPQGNSDGSSPWVLSRVVTTTGLDTATARRRLVTTVTRSCGLLVALRVDADVKITRKCVAVMGNMYWIAYKEEEEEEEFIRCFDFSDETFNASALSPLLLTTGDNRILIPPDPPDPDPDNPLSLTRFPPLNSPGSKTPKTSRRQSRQTLSSDPSRLNSTSTTLTFAHVDGGANIPAAGKNQPDTSKNTPVRSKQSGGKSLRTEKASSENPQTLATQSAAHTKPSTSTSPPLHPSLPITPLEKFIVLSTKPPSPKPMPSGLNLPSPTSSLLPSQLLTLPFKLVSPPSPSDHPKKRPRQTSPSSTQQFSSFTAQLKFFSSSPALPALDPPVAKPFETLLLAQTPFLF
ncbi:hypothetical protein YC2023_038464 [Brassica napus]